MRGRLSSEHIEYIKDLELAIKEDSNFAYEIVTIDDQLMTAQQAVELLKTNDLTSRAYGSRKSYEQS